MCVICKKGKKLLFKGLFLILKIKNKKMTCKYNLQVNILNNILFNQICKKLYFSINSNKFCINSFLCYSCSVDELE